MGDRPPYGNDECARGQASYRPLGRTRIGGGRDLGRGIRTWHEREWAAVSGRGARPQLLRLPGSRDGRVPLHDSPGRVARTAGGYDPRLSPDTRTIAYARDGREIWLVKARGGGHRLLTRPPRGAEDRSPAWSPDGTTLIFVRATPPPRTSRAATALRSVRSRRKERVRLAVCSPRRRTSSSPPGRPMAAYSRSCGALLCPAPTRVDASASSCGSPER